MQPKVGGRFHLKLNTGEKPIVNKYREGKMKRTLKRELKVLEIVKREAIELGMRIGRGINSVLSEKTLNISGVSLFMIQSLTGLTL